MQKAAVPTAWPWLQVYASQSLHGKFFRAYSSTERECMTLTRLERAGLDPA